MILSVFLSLFSGVQLTGTQAVDVVTRYQDTVSTISQSQGIVATAGQSLGRTQQRVADRSLTTLQEEALQSRQDSTALLDTVSARDTNPAGKSLLLL